MRLALISTWLQPCGIATYCEILSAHLRDLGHDVVILAEETDRERDDAQVDLSGIEVVRCWDRRDPRYNDGIRDAIRKTRPDVVHIQHEYGLFRNPDAGSDTGQGAFLKLLLDLPRRTPLVITPHTITHRTQHQYAWIWPHLKARRATVICHTPPGRDVLGNEYLYPTAWTRHIPHASPDPSTCKRLGKPMARQLLDLPQDRVVLASIGFIGDGKRQDATLTAINDGLDAGILRESDLWFVIAGAPGGGWDASDRYVDRLTGAIRDWGLDSCCELRRGFVPFEDFPRWFSAIDFAVNLSTENGCYSASGRIRLPAAYGCPQLVEMVHLHRDLEHVVEPVESGDSVGLMKAITKMIRNRAHREQLGRAGRAYAQMTAWPKIATMHAQVYEEIRG